MRDGMLASLPKAVVNVQRQQRKLPGSSEGPVPMSLSFAGSMCNPCTGVEVDGIPVPMNAVQFMTSMISALSQGGAQVMVQGPTGMNGRVLDTSPLQNILYSRGEK